MAKKLGLLERTGEAFFNDVKKLISLAPATIQTIAQRVNTDQGFDTSLETLATVRSDVELDAETLQSVIGVATFLRQHLLNEGRAATQPLLAELAEYCAEKQIEDYERRLPLIESLIEIREAFDELRDRATYQQGVLYSLDSVSAVHDLRAVFDDDGNLVTFIPMLLLRFILENDQQDSRAFAFQVSEDGLRQLHASLSKYLDKMATVAAAAPVLNQVREGRAE